MTRSRSSARLALLNWSLSLIHILSTRRVDFAVDDEKESGYTEEAKPVPRDADGRTGKKNKKGKKPPKRRTKGENKS